MIHHMPFSFLCCFWQALLMERDWVEMKNISAKSSYFHCLHWKLKVIHSKKVMFLLYYSFCQQHLGNVWLGSRQFTHILSCIWTHPKWRPSNLWHVLWQPNILFSFKFIQLYVKLPHLLVHKLITITHFLLNLRDHYVTCRGQRD